MQSAKAFFFVAAGLFLLGGAFHLGATTATAQKAGTPTPIAGWHAQSNSATSANGSLAVMSNGDV